MSKTAVFAVALLALVTIGAWGFDPVILAGTDLEATGGSQTIGVSFAIRPQLAVSWRELLTGGGYLVLSSRAILAVPLDEANGVSDSESASVEFSVPLDSNQFIAGIAVDASFVSNGNPRTSITPSWRADLRFLNDDGWLGILTDGRYRLDAADDDDALVHRLGLGYSNMASIRLGYDAELRGGYEYWPEYPVVDDTGSTTGEARQDLIARLDAGAEGLWGYFTTWSAGGLLEGRFSNATRYTASVDEFERDSESRITGGLAASLRTSPVREVSVGGSLGVDYRSYFERDARNETGTSVGETLRVASVSASLSSDYSPVDNLFIVGSIGGGATFTNEEPGGSSYIQGRIGVEYSF